MLSNAEWQTLEDDDLDDVLEGVLFGAEQEVFRIPGGTTDPGLGITEYLEYKQEVEAKRRQAKADYAASERAVFLLSQTLLDRYDKLFNLVTERTERDEARMRKHSGDDVKLTTLRMQESDYKEKLLEEIDKLEKDKARAVDQFDSNQVLLSDFLMQNGSIANAVEKAEALDTEHRRKGLRKKAHDQILEAFQGVAEQQSNRDMFKLMREQRDAFSSDEDLRSELKKLREYEEITDDLVDRVKLKVESIDLLEESQGYIIQHQITKQSQLNHKIKEMKRQVEKNNTDLEMVVDKVETEVSDKIDALLSKPVLNCICCLVLIIGVTMLGAGTYYVILQTRL